MYGRGSSDRSYSPWWTRLRILFSVLSVLSSLAFVILLVLKVEGSTAVREWSWRTVCIPTLATALGAALVYSVIRYVTRHAAFTYTSDAAASYLLGLKTSHIDWFHQLNVFRDALLCMGFILLCAEGISIATLGCRSCNTPYSLLSIGAGVLYFLRALHVVLQALGSWRRWRLMVVEVGKFQEFLDQSRLFNQVLPDLVVQGRALHTWVSCFLTMAVWMLTGLGSVWVSNRNCMDSCVQTVLACKYLLMGMVSLEVVYWLSELYLAYRLRISGVENLERLIDRLDCEAKMEKRKHYQLLQAEKQKRMNDSTSSR